MTYVIPSMQRFATLLLAILLAATTTPVSSQERSADDNSKATKKPAKPAFVKPAKTRYIQLKRDKAGKAEALQTAVVRFVPESGDSEIIVDLIGAVHVGDRLYYQKLNKLFENYDVLLYELVAPEGTVIPKGGKRESTNPLGTKHLFVGRPMLLKRTMFLKRSGDTQPSRSGRPLKWKEKKLRS